MNCRNIRELLPLYLTGEIDPSSATNFSAHLRGCPPCAQQVEREIYFDIRLRDIVLSDTNETEARPRLRVVGAPGPGLRESSAAFARQRLIVTVLGAATAVLLLNLGNHGALGPLPALAYADAAHDHQVEVVDRQPRRWLADGDRIAALAAREGIPRTAIVAAAPEGYRLAGARLCWIGSRIFLHLIYSNGARQISLYLRQRAEDPRLEEARDDASQRRLHGCDLGGEHVVSFHTDRVIAFVVSSQSADDAWHFGRFFASAL